MRGFSLAEVLASRPGPLPPPPTPTPHPRLPLSHTPPAHTYTYTDTYTYYRALWFEYWKVRSVCLRVEGGREERAGSDSTRRAHLSSHSCEGRLAGRPLRPAAPSAPFFIRGRRELSPLLPQ